MSADAPKPILCSAPGCFELVSRSFAYGSGGYCRQHAPPLQAQAGGPAVGGAQDRPAWETDDERRESCDDPDSDSEDEEERLVHPTIPDSDDGCGYDSGIDDVYTVCSESDEVLDESDEEGEEELAGGAAATRQRWTTLADEPIYVGSELTVRDFCYLQVKSKVEGVTDSNATFERNLKLAKATHPQPNNIPTRMDQVRVVLGVPDYSTVEYFVCLGPDDGSGPHSECGPFPQLKPHEYKDHADDACPCCGTSRFVSKTNMHGETQLEHRHPPCYFMGVCSGIRALHADITWCEERTHPRDGEHLAHTQFGAQYVARVNAKANGALFDPDNGVYELGADGILPFKWNESLEVTVFSIRELGIGMHARGKLDYTKPVLSIVSKGKVAHLGPYMRLIDNDFDVLENEGIKVYNSYLEKEVLHKGYLLFACGDTPFQTAFANAWGHTASWVCFRCFFQANHGTTLGGGGGVFPVGYSKPAEQRHGLYKYSVELKDGVPTFVRKRLAATTIMCADAQTVTSDMMTALALDAEKQIESGSNKITTPCVKGRSLLWRRLLFEPRWGITIAISHCFLYGIIKKFIKLCLPKAKRGSSGAYVIAADKRAVMSKRASQFFSPHDTTRKYKDVTKSLGGWTMEDFGFFLGTAGMFIFRDAWPGGDNSPFWKIWVNLHRVYHIMFDSTAKRPPGALATAEACMQEAAKLSEENMHHSMCTPNLHQFVKHPFETEPQTGNMAASNETWVERICRKVVAPARQRNTKLVGPFLANEMLLSARLVELSRVISVTVESLTGEGAGQDVRRQSRRAHLRMEDPASKSVALESPDYISSSGVAFAPSADDMTLIKSLLAEDVDFINLSAGELVCYKAGCAVRGRTDIHSRMYRRTRERCSWNVAVKYADDGPDGGLHYGEVLAFWLLRLRKDGEDDEFFRLARVKLFKRVWKPTDEAPFGVVDTSAAPYNNAGDKLVLLSSIDHKVVFFPLSKTRTMAVRFLKN